MADIRPFAALRPRADLSAQITAPPYDVLDREEARDWLRRHPNSFLRVTRSDALLPDDLPARGPEARARARRELDRMRSQGLLVRDPHPRFYLYEQTMGEHVQLGLVVGVSAQEYEQGRIKRHEKTRAGALEDRRAHLEAVGANTGLVFLTYRAVADLDALLAELSAAAAEVDFVADDGNRQRLWGIDGQEAQRRLIELFARVPALYVADGHHRTHASYQVWRARRDTAPGEPGTRGIDHFMAVLFPHDHLQILAYNRLVTDLAGHAPAALVQAACQAFTVAPTELPEPPSRGCFGMFLDGRWYRLAPRPELRAALPPAGDPRALDVAVLQEYLLAPILGIGDPRTDPRIRFIGGIRGSAELERRARATGGVAFAVFPTAIEDVMEIADADEVMPAKSTWFEPKLMSGLVVRELDL